MKFEFLICGEVLVFFSMPLNCITLCYPELIYASVPRACKWSTCNRKSHTASLLLLYNYQFKIKAIDVNLMF